MTCYPVTKPIRSAEPAFENEPLTEADARRQCGANPGYPPDEDFRDWIILARKQVEHDAQIVFYTGTFVWRLTEFPFGDIIEIPCIRPVTAITSITYIDGSGATQTLSSSDYSLDANGLVPMVKLNYGYVWPMTREDINGLTITLVAGFTAAQKTDPQYRQYVQPVIVKVRSQYRTALGEDSRRDEELYDRLVALVGRDVVG